MNRAADTKVVARETLWAMAGLLATAAAVEAALRWLAGSGRLMFLQNGTASAAAFALRALGQHVVISGNSVVTAQGAVTVAELCLPITPVAVAAGLFLFATPTKPVRRAAWFAAILALLQLVNVARIMVVALFLQAGSPLAGIFHREVLPVALVGVVVVCWIIELRYAEQPVRDLPRAA